MNWNTHSDEVIFSISELTEYANSLPLTKRSILKVTSKIYDHMGFISPVTVKMKVLYQEVCIDKTNWDSELKGETLKKWKLILQELKMTDCYRIPRCYFSHQPIDVR